MDPLAARDLFPIAERYIHMNHAGVSPMSQRSRVAVEQVVDAMMSRPYRDHWAQEEADRVRGLVGRLVNAPAGSIGLTRSTAHGMSLLAQGLSWEKGDNVVGATGEYPANVYPWLNLARRGVEFRQAPAVEGRISPDSVMELVDSRTRLVAVSHVEFWNGFRLDIESIGAECRRRGIFLAVDVMQSAGALQIDLERLPVDFCAAGAGKWLMGPPGIGFCFCTAPLLERLQQVVVGVGSVAGHDQYFEYDLTPAAGARRFEESVVSLLDTAALRSALELLLEVGPAAIEARVLNLSRKLADGLAAAGYEIIEPWPRAREESSGIVSFRKNDVPATSLLHDLTSANVIARTHRDFVRLSPHFYNTDQEVDRVLEILAPERVNR